MKRYLLSIGLLLLGFSSFTACIILPEDSAKQFLALLQNEVEITSVDSKTIQTIGQWLDNAFDIQQYEALPPAQKIPFLYTLFPERKEKFFCVGETKYSISRETTGSVILYQYDEIGNLKPHVLFDATMPPEANPPVPIVNLPSAPSIALNRAYRALHVIVQSPYFKSSCLAVASGIVVYYWTTWTNKGKKERRQLPAKKVAICAAVLVGVGSFSYFGHN